MELADLVTSIFTPVFQAFSTIFLAADLHIGGILITFPVFVAASILVIVVSTILGGGGDDD